MSTFRYIYIHICIFYNFSDTPIVSLKFGTSLNPSNIAEGNDVYFECEIDANPDAYKIVWLHNVSTFQFIKKLSTHCMYDFTHVYFFIKGHHGNT